MNCGVDMKISVVDGSICKAVGVGSVHFSKLTLRYVFHGLNIRCNLISLSKLKKDLKYL